MAYKNEKSNPRKKYTAQKAHAKEREIDFLLSYDEWWQVWEESGHWENRGRGSQKFCMCRVGDKGGYEIGNVYIATNADNAREAKKVGHI
jgi:hypothetical protein